MALIVKIEFSRLHEIERDNIWSKKIIGKADVEIAKLVQRLNLNDWVNEGRTYIGDDETCPFCQQPTIDDSFKKQLDSYFDESFVADTELVKSLHDEYNQTAMNMINLLLQIESTEKANNESKMDIEKFSAYVKTASSQFASNRELLSNKQKEPSRSIALISVQDQLKNILTLINDANSAIKAHNVIVTNYSVERSKLVEEVWRFITDEGKIRIQHFVDKQIGLDKGINALEKRVAQLFTDYKAKDKEVKDLSKNVTSIQPSIDQINTTLSSYGFHNFSIVPSPADPNKYQIQRENGVLADATLSEGEITFITFLYFLQLTKGSVTEDNISDERILIVDDPISSLDSSVLFVVSCLITEIIIKIKGDKSNIKQLILLTHNVYFHKEVSFIDGKTSKCKDAFFWILRRKINKSSIECFEMENPIQNSYEILWMELKNRDKNSRLTIQNIMRRIIENYFKILGKYKDDALIQKFPTHEEQEICRSLLCWINDGSHVIPDDLFIEHQEDIINKYFEVFKNIFTHTNHAEHYNMMMGEVEEVA